MTPEEENQELKEQIKKMSTTLVALTAYQQEILRHESTKGGAVMTLKLIAQKYNIPEESLISTFNYARDIVLDQSLSTVQRNDPALAAILDDREIDEVPTFPEDRLK